MGNFGETGDGVVGGVKDKGEDLIRMRWQIGDLERRLERHQKDIDNQRAAINVTELQGGILPSGYSPVQIMKILNSAKDKMNEELRELKLKEATLNV